MAKGDNDGFRQGRWLRCFWMQLTISSTRRRRRGCQSQAERSAVMDLTSGELQRRDGGMVRFARRQGAHRWLSCEPRTVREHL
ncbi:hypothetical protein V6N12_006588 [Hibiscus sabdariffa]|uniref:Uncharacterized protein n=1 Tax=Hibiscus sabdariffa TaxID=183260 RepID=A0ABR2EZ90_9ROSI